VTLLNPLIHTVFVLERLVVDSLRWLGDLRLGVGQPFGPAVKGARREWQLHRAVKLAPATAQTATGASPP
jgi:hypothetical protein